MAKHSKITDSSEELIPQAKLIGQIINILKGILKIAQKVIKISK